MHLHPGPLEVAFTIRGPITRADLPGLCDRVCALLPGSGQVVHYRVGEFEVIPEPATLLLLTIGAFAGPEELAEMRAKLDAACEKQGRDPATLPLSVMTGWIVGRTREEVVDRASRLSEWKGEGADGEKFLAGQRDAVIVGTVEEAVERLRALHEAGCHRVMAQHLLHRDTEAIELIGREVAPLVAAF